MRNAAWLGAGLAGVLAGWAALADAKVADTYSVAPGTADSAAIMPCTSVGTGAFACPNLRSALDAAAQDDGSTVKLSAGMYTLSNGQLKVDAKFNTLTIAGAGSGATTITQTAGAGERVFKLVSQDATVSISGVTITGGDQRTVDGTCTTVTQAVDGGAILNAGTLTLGGVTVSGNKATGGDGANASSGSADSGLPADGGGVCSSGPLTVLDSTITGNVAEGGNGGKGSAGASGGFGGAAFGGGVESTDDLSVSGTTVSSNHALGGTGGKATGTGDGGGGGGADSGGIGVTQGVGITNPTTSITDSRVTDNTELGGTGGNATGSGHLAGGGGVGFGGLSTNSFGATTITSSTISDNAATGGVPGTPANGASVFAAGNAGGAGLEVTGPLTLTGSTLSGNRASGGAPATSGGGGGFGGAIYLSDPTTIVNSTITGNQVSAGAGQHAFGGAIFDQQIGTATLTLASVTIAGNSANATTAAMATGGNLYHGPNSPISARNTIIAAGAASGGAANCDGKIASDVGHNLESTTPSQCGLNPDAGDVIGSDPLLGPLAGNGGPTETMAPGTGSPAVGAGGVCTDPSAGGQPLKTDQRGDPRTNPCDIGAFDGQPPTVVVAPAITGHAGVGDTLTCLPGDYAGDGPISSGFQWQRGATAIPGATGAGYTVALADAGRQLTCQETATNPYGSALATSPAVSVANPPPTVSALRQSHRNWRTGSRLATISRKRTPVGTTFSFTLDLPARLSLSFARLLPGRRSGHKCVKQTGHNRHHRSCTRAAGAGTLTISTGHSGLDKIGFQGRLSKHKRLRPGNYRLTLVATGDGGKSAPRMIKFTIMRG